MSLSLPRTPGAATLRRGVLNERWKIAGRLWLLKIWVVVPALGRLSKLEEEFFVSQQICRDLIGRRVTEIHESLSAYEISRSARDAGDFTDRLFSFQSGQAERRLASDSFLTASQRLKESAAVRMSNHRQRHDCCERVRVGWSLDVCGQLFPLMQFGRVRRVRHSVRISVRDDARSRRCQRLVKIASFSHCSRSRFHLALQDGTYDLIAPGQRVLRLLIDVVDILTAVRREASELRGET